jgi:hypothetical protein
MAVQREGEGGAAGAGPQVQPAVPTRSQCTRTKVGRLRTGVCHTAQSRSRAYRPASASRPPAKPRCERTRRAAVGSSVVISTRRRSLALAVVSCTCLAPSAPLHPQSARDARLQLVSSAFSARTPASATAQPPPTPHPCAGAMSDPRISSKEAFQLNAAAA